jgi:hypothetical protein
VTQEGCDDDSKAVADLAMPSPTVGPVRLAEAFEQFALLIVELPGLSRAKVFDWLQSHGHAPPDMGEDQELAGFVYVAGSMGVVFVKADEFLPRKRFTAAHELGHFLLHRDLMQGGRWIDDRQAAFKEVDDGELARHEKEANRFAAALLMPEKLCRTRAAALRVEFPKMPDAVVAHRLAADLLVSREAMGYRLKELRVTHGSE